MQWHPQLNIGVAYAPSLIAWHDFINTKAAELQLEVVNCSQGRAMQENVGSKTCSMIALIGIFETSMTTVGTMRKSC